MPGSHVRAPAPSVLRRRRLVAAGAALSVVAAGGAVAHRLTERPATSTIGAAGYQAMVGHPDRDTAADRSRPALDQLAPTVATTSVRTASATSQAKAQAAFAAATAKYLAGRRSRAGVAALDTASGIRVQYGQHTRFITASVVKAHILATLLLQRSDQRRSLTAAEKASAKRMITQSDNTAASTLWRTIGGGAGITAANRRFGLVETTPGTGGYWGLTRTTAADQLRLLQVLSSPGVLSASHRSYALGLMKAVVRGQRWGVSAAARSDEPYGLKNGWLATSTDSGLWATNSIGRIETSARGTVLIAVLSQHSPSMNYGITTVERLARQARTNLGTA